MEKTNFNNSSNFNLKDQLSELFNPLIYKDFTLYLVNRIFAISSITVVLIGCFILFLEYLRYLSTPINWIISSYTIFGLIFCFILFLIITFSYIGYLVYRVNKPEEKE